MGTAFSYFTRKVSSSNIQRDPVEEMAESKPRDVSRQHTPVTMSPNDFTRYKSAFQVVQEFLDYGGSMMERQTTLESELQTCQERYDRTLYYRRSVYF